MKKFGDPINEANVYLAFGRKMQAVKLLEAAVNENPAREDLRLKLTEIKNSALAAKGLSIKQSIISIVLMIVGATLKFSNYLPRFNDVGSVIGFCALFYMAACLARGRGA